MQERFPRLIKASASLRPRGLACAAAALVLLLAHPAVAQTTYYWAPDAGAGGTGNWNSTDLFWAPNADGSGTKVAWNSTPTTNSAYFGGTAGTVTTGAAVSTNQIQFTTTGYLLAGDATNTITFNGSAPSVLLAEGVAAEISAGLAADSAGLTIGSISGTTGSTLTLSGTSSVTGMTAMGAGQVVLATGGSLTSGTLEVATGRAGATSSLRIKSGASMSIGRGTVGTGIRPTAAVVQEGGTASFSTALIIGTNNVTSVYAGTPSYTLESGAINVSGAGAFLTVGRNANAATFTQTGGTVTIDRLTDAITIGDYGSGTYSISAGSLVMIGGTSSNALLGFRGGSGTLGINGTAAVRIRGSLFLAVNQLNSSSTKGSATINLQGGDLAVNGITRGQAGITGANGAGSVAFTISGGTLRPYNANIAFGSATAGRNFDITLSGTAGTISGLDASATPVARTVDLFANLVGSGGVTLSGGTINLNAANSHAGPTTIAANTSVILNGSFANSSAVTVNGSLSLAGKTTGFTFGAGQTVGGAGTITLPTTGPGVSLAGFLAPGNSPGTLTFSGAGTFDLTAAVTGTAGRLLFELGTPDLLAASDLVLVPDGTLAIGTSLLGFDSFAFTPLAGFGPGTYTLFSANSISGSLDPARTTGSLGGLSAELTATGTTISLVIVPEPAAIALAAAGIVAAAVGLRRRRAGRWDRGVGIEERSQSSKETGSGKSHSNDDEKA